MSTTSFEQSFLGTRRGKLMLALLCAVAFLDFVDASIVNIALPSIRHDLHFSVQSLQWVLSGYLLTYGGFMLLGGRAADLLGRRRVARRRDDPVRRLVALRRTGGQRRRARRCPPRAGCRRRDDAPRGTLDPDDDASTKVAIEHKALGVWGGVGGLASAVGVLLGGVLTARARMALGDLRQPARLRAGAGRDVPADLRRTGAARALENFDALGAVLSTGGMLLLVYALVRAPLRRLGFGPHDRRDRGRRSHCWLRS